MGILVEWVEVEEGLWLARPILQLDLETSPGVGQVRLPDYIISLF